MRHLLILRIKILRNRLDLPSKRSSLLYKDVGRADGVYISKSPTTDRSNPDTSHFFKRANTALCCYSWFPPPPPPPRGGAACVRGGGFCRSAYFRRAAFFAFQVPPPPPPVRAESQFAAGV